MDDWLATRGSGIRYENLCSAQKYGPDGVIQCGLQGAALSNGVSERTINGGVFACAISLAVMIF